MSVSDVNVKLAMFHDEFIAHFEERIAPLLDSLTPSEQLYQLQLHENIVEKDETLDISNTHASELKQNCFKIGPFLLSKHSFSACTIISTSETTRSNTEKDQQLRLEYIHKIIEETAHEVTIIYEYQIALIKHLIDIKKSAVYAVDRIFEISECPFTVSALINILLTPKENTMLSDVLSVLHAANVVEIIDNKFIEPRQLFEQVGLRIQTAGGKFEFRVKDGLDDPLCGFRGVFHTQNNSNITGNDSTVDNSSGYDHCYSDVDSQYSITITGIRTNLLNAQHASLYRYVTQIELDSYCSLFSNTTTPTVNAEKVSFSSYYRNYNGIFTEQPLVLVFRSIQFTESLYGCDFSNCDLSGLYLHNIELIDCNFSHCRMINTTFCNVNVEGSNFKNTDLRWSNLHNVSLCGVNTNLFQTNLNYCVFGPGVDVTENTSFSSTSTKHEFLHYISDILLYTPLSVVNNMESMIQTEAATIATLVHESTTPSRANNVELVQDENVIVFPVMRNAVTEFAGRQESMERIHAHFSINRDSYAVCVLYGNSGVGKTQCALQYIADQKSLYDNRVFWCSAATVETLSESYHELACILHICTDGLNDTQIIHAVHRKLMTIEQILFAFDNVTDLSILSDYLPINTKHHVIITTTLSAIDFPKTYHCEMLNIFTTAELSGLHTNTLSHEPFSSMYALGELVEFHPVSLTSSVAYINNTQCAIDEYIFRYNTRLATILAHDNSSIKSTAVNIQSITDAQNTVVSIAIDNLIICRYDLAMLLLKVLAYLGTEPVLIQLLTNMNDCTTQQLYDAIAVLNVSKLITVYSDANNNCAVSMHTLIQQIVQTRFKFEQFHIVTITAELLLKHFESEHYECILQSTCLIENYRDILHNIIEKCNQTATIMSKLCLLCSKILIDQSNYTLALDILVICDLILFLYDKLNTQEAVTLCHYLSTVHSKLNQYEISFQDCIRALNITQQLYLQSHKKTKKSNKKADYFGTLESLRVSDILQHINIEDSKQVEFYSETLFYLGNVYTACSNYTSANTTFMTVKYMYEVQFGHNSLNVINCLTQLAHVCVEQSNYTTAVEHLLSALHILELLRNCKLDTVRIIQLLATVYCHIHDYSSSLISLHDSERLLIELYCDAHITITHNLYEIANIHFSVHNYTEALSQYEIVLQTYQHLYGRQSLKYAHTLSRISVVELYLKFEGLAATHHQQAMCIFEILLGRQDIEISNILGNMAMALSECLPEDLVQTMALFCESLQIRVFVMKTAIDKKLCTNFTTHFNNTIKRFLNKLLQLSNDVFMLPEHNNFAQNIYDIAVIHQQYNVFESEFTKTLFTFSLHIAKLQEVKNNVLIYSNLIALSDIAYCAGSYHEDISLLNHAIEVSQLVSGYDCSDVAECFRKLGNAFYLLNDLDNSRVSYEECIRIHCDVLHTAASYTLSVTLRSVARINLQLGYHSQALKHFQVALTMLVTLQGRNSLECSECIEEIGKLQYLTRDFLSAQQSFLDAAKLSEERGQEFVDFTALWHQRANESFLRVQRETTTPIDTPQSPQKVRVEDALVFEQSKNRPNVLVGDCEVDQNTLKCVNTSRTQQSVVNCSAFPIRIGKWYYEITIITGGSVQVGWCRKAVSTVSGDSNATVTATAIETSAITETLYAYDGSKRLLLNDTTVTQEEWGVTWAMNDVVGCYVDCEKKTIGFSLNGVRTFYGMGIAFKDVYIADGIYPVVTLTPKSEVQFSFGGAEHELKYLPSGYRPYSEYITEVYKLLDGREQLLTTIHKHGKDSIETAYAMNMVACLARDQGLWLEAHKGFIEVLRLTTLLVGQDSVEVAYVLHNLGRVYYAQDLYTQALTSYTESLHIRELKLGADSYECACSLLEIGRVYIQMNNHGLARECLSEAENIFMTQCGEDSQEVVEIRRELQYIGGGSRINSQGEEIRVSTEEKRNTRSKRESCIVC